ncbi:MAG: hypothetical protein QM730_24945 [Anaerolineales bacterium]
MKVERVQFERTGGFAGIRFAADFKPEELPHDQSKELFELLDDLDFDELPEEMMGEGAVPDSFSYTVTVETTKWKHTVTTGDTSAPEKMQELLQLLNRIARNQMRKQ